MALTQHYLDKLNEWQKTWLLNFNTKDGKCKVLHIGKNNPNNAYFLDGVSLPLTNAEKDLGIIINQKLSWVEQIQKSIAKAKSMIGWTTKNVISRKKDVLMNTNKSLVRPHLKYCTQLWNPAAKHGN